MNIVIAPHPSLRQVAKEIIDVDQALVDLVTNMHSTLEKNKRHGVGLAAPQVDRNLRLFVTRLKENGEYKPKVFINPRLTKTWGDPVLGKDKENVKLEGCLSIPSLYGPVPRFLKIRLEYEILLDDKLVTRDSIMESFPARLAQHELDHLNGILFTDYSLEYELPLYQEDKDTGELKELKSYSLVESF